MSQRAMIRVITVQVSEHTPGQVLAPPSKNRHIFVPLPDMLMIQQSASVGRTLVTCSTEPFFWIFFFLFCSINYGRLLCCSLGWKIKT